MTGSRVFFKSIATGVVSIATKLIFDVSNFRYHFRNNSAITNYWADYVMIFSMVFPLMDSTYCRRVRKFSITRSNSSLCQFRAIISDSIFAMNSSNIVGERSA